MLVVHRREGERFILAHPTLPADIIVTVCECQMHRVKLGIDAPLSVNVAREELLQRAQETEQGEQSNQPDCWLVADRTMAKQNAGPQGRAYIKALEQIARLADEYQTATAYKTRTPHEHALSDELLDALGKVNFLAAHDTVEEEDLERLDILTPQTT